MFKNKAICIWIFIFLTAFLISCQEKTIRKVKNFIPVVWEIKNAEKGSVNIFNDLAVNIITLKTNGECGLPTSLSKQQQQVMTGTWDVKEINNRYCLVMEQSENQLSGNYTIFIQRDTLKDGRDVISLLLDSGKTKIWAVRPVNRSKKEAEMLKELIWLNEKYK
jgi:hypothetical protein